jgi:hypothetical protein
MVKAKSPMRTTRQRWNAPLNGRPKLGLFPAEQTRIVQLLVRRVTATSEGMVIDVRTDGVSGVMRDMMAPRKKVAAE